MKVIRMTVEQFCDTKKYPDNKIQRDTQRHSLTFSRPGGHLEHYHPTHMRVAIAVTDKGKVSVLDGHSRRYLWKEGKLDYPKGEKLWVDVYDVADEQESMLYYLTFDADGSHETTNDRLYGCWKYLGFRPENKPGFYRNIGLVSVVKFLAFERKWGQLKHLSMNTLFKPWIPTLRLIDTKKLYLSGRFPAVVCAALMMTVRRDGDAAMEFWADHHDDLGTKSQQSTNGIYMANEVLEAFQNPTGNAARHDYRRGRRFNYFTSRFLHCYDRWYGKKRFPLAIGTGQSHWTDAATPLEWWDEHIGAHDHPELRAQQPLELDDA